MVQKVLEREPFFVPRKTNMLGALISIIILTSALNPVNAGGGIVEKNILATHSFSLNNRHAVPSVNNVFKDNILLNYAYLSGRVTNKTNLDWDVVRSESKYEFTLNPGERFAFHDHIDKKYAENVVKTTNAHFNYDDGFKHDGYLMGDGVCHFASLINWVALDAGLETYVPKNHDFARIPDVSKEYGVSIYWMPDSGEMNNLYIYNNKEKSVTFEFEYKNEELTVSVNN